MKTRVKNFLLLPVLLAALGLLLAVVPNASAVYQIAQVNITSPTPGEVVTNQTLEVTGSVTRFSTSVAVSNLLFEISSNALENFGWQGVQTTVKWTNWTANATLMPGSNTVSAYLVDTNGNFSATNSVTFDYVVTAGGLFAFPPGTPESGLLNPGGQLISTTLGGGIGAQPITNNASQFGANATTFAGDIVFLINANNGNNPTNWAAVLRFINPADPTGTNGLYATEYETYFQTNAGPNYFSGFSLLPNVDYLTITVTNTTDGSIVGGADVFGPTGAILGGQEDVLIYTASIQPSADVSLSATTGAGAITLGSGEAYSLTVSNAGPSAANGLVISNRIPANEIFVSVTGGATPVNGVLLVNLGTLAAGAATNITLAVNPGLPAGAAYGQFTNQFQVFASTTDPVLTNNSATVVSSVSALIPGTPITGSTSFYGQGSFVVLNGQVFGSGPLVEGIANQNTNLDFIAYTATPGDFILLNNPAGGSNPTNWVAVVRFFNPADPTGTNGLAATYSQAFFTTNFGGAGFASLQLFPNTNYVVVGPLATPTNFPAYITFTVTQYGQAGVILAGQEAITVWTVTSPYTDLSLSASAAPQPVSVGSNLVYTITVSNAPDVLQAPNTVTATGVVVSNRIPANCTFVSATGGATPTNGVLLVNLGSLTEGTNVSIQVTVQPAAAGSLTNNFQVFANEFDPNLTNNSATVVSTVTNAPVVAAPGVPGTPIAWTNPGGALVITSTFGFAGNPIPIQTGAGGPGGNPASTCQAGDLVLLINTNGVTASTNWAAVERFFNPADPIGTQGLAATYSQTFFATNFGGSGFNGYQLFPVVSYIPEGTVTTNDNGLTTFVTSYTQFGPVDGIIAGQEDIVVVTLDTLTSAVNITSPTSGQVVSNAALTVTSSTTNFLFTGFNLSAVLTNVFVQLNGGSWTSATTLNGWTNWSANVTLTPGSNTVSAYAVNGYGSFSPTNSVTFDYATNAGAQFAGPPGTPVSGFNNLGGTFTVIPIGGGIGVQPITNNAEQFFANATAFAGDVVFLRDPNGGNNPTNWEAVLRFVNPSDPTGTNGLTATEYETYFQTNAGPNQFAGFSLLPNVVFASIIGTNTDGSITAQATVIGPVGDILAGQTAVLIYTASIQPGGSADLSLSVTESPNPVNVAVSNILTYTFIVSNAGPATATDVTVSNQLFTQTSSLVFISATGGGTPTNGILLMNLGSLAAGATNTAQMTVSLDRGGPASFYTNTFQVYADQTDLNLTNNSATVIFEGTGANITQFTTSTAEYNTTNTTTVSEQLTNYTTELIAKLPNGTVEYDQTFSVPYANATVQSAIASAALALTNAGVSAYTGPAQTGMSLTTNDTSVTVNDGTNITVIVGVKIWVGPQTISVGNFGVVTGYTFDSVDTNYAIPTGGTPGSLTLNSGQTDNDTMVLSLFDFFLTTTNTSTYTNSSVYVMTGVVAQADLSLTASAAPQPVDLESNLVYSLTVSNAGPNAATGVVISNQIPGGVTFVSATGGATPTNGVLLVNLGSLAVGATNSAQIVVNVYIEGNKTNVFQVSANEFDPNLTNNSATVDSIVLGVNSTIYTSGSGEYDTTNTTTVSQQVTNYSTELIAKLPNGTIVFDQTFSAAFSDPTVQAAITTAAGDLTGAGDLSYTGPAQTSFLQTTNNTSVTVLTSTNAGIIVGSKIFIGPQTNLVGSFGQIQGYTLVAGYTGTNYFIPTSWNGSPTSFSVAPGQEDIDTRVLTLVTNNFTTTITDTNLNSSVYVMTGIVAQADLKLTAGAAPEPVGVGSNLVYSISITNQGPNAASGVTVSNQIPAGVNFVSATGGATPSNGVLLVNLGSLATGTVTNAQVTVQPTAAGKLTNLFQVFATTTDPVLTNNSATVVSTVTNAPPPAVDVALSLMAAPNPVGVGAPLTYSLTVTNNSPMTATDVIVTDTLPVNVTLFSLLPSEGSASNHAGVVTYNVGSLPNGIADTLAIVVIPNAAGLLTNVAVAFSAQTDSQPANNFATNVTTAVSVPITNLVLTVLSPMTLNPQTGLFEQQVQVSNGGPSTPSSVLVLVSGLAANATLYNAAGKTNGLPFVQSASPLGIGSNVVFLLEFYVPTRAAPTNLTFTVVAGPPFIPLVVSGTIMNIDRMIVLSDGSVLIEFTAIPGQIYAVQYSSDMATWRTAVPAITAPANRVQWIDAGPPKTDSNPAQQPARYYRVVLLTPR